ncbi:hypothetical protein B0T11DRAFT_105898 [Plectosphaerella cucumerina]|uniref:Uncharacterized protein n=1 Tax=Plectosphaerella cucumerina TaxID=40658 RepID=A0A8K0TFI6_9PEZI|nr:hypothetical protein B0T11DRAFT_105898 [Plectosphaerella cucumerina]
MTSKDDRDVDIDDRPREKRKSKSKRPEGDKEKDKDKERKPSSRSSRSKKEGGSEVSHSSHRRHRTREEKERSASTSELVFDFGRSKSSLVSMERVSLPYPTFSKAHSKEAVHSREDVSGSASGRRPDPLTPEATDIGGRKERPERPRSPDYTESPKAPKSKEARPPSPPETDLSGKRRSGSGTPDTAREEKKERPSSRLSSLSRSASRNDEKSRLSTKSKTSSQATYVKTAQYIPPGIQESLGVNSRGPSRSSSKRSVSSKGGKQPDLVDADSSPESAQDSSPRTPIQAPQFPPTVYPMSDPKHFSVFDEPNITPSGTPATDMGDPLPPPPPPPPPVLNVQEAPRVDYLLLNGGLPYAAPKNFLSVLPRQNGSRPSNPPLTGAQTLFAPFFNLLEQYNTVLQKNGSVAVATGHRSVARRLLDRLENVFSRELPPHGCGCVMCDRDMERHIGLGWGEVLEWVSGRIELPPWPPIDLAELGVKAAEMSADLPPRPASPIKMDPDIAEEFREHYLRQTKKVRGAVDKWLTKCDGAPVPPSQDVDDETLSFAILTNLDPEERPYFNAILTGSREILPSIRAPTPVRRPRTEFVIKAGLSLQRLYRLQQAPRDAETATYLVKHPHTHDLIVALSDINTSEWEILTSGRFDGFLWSGADTDDIPTPTADSGGHFFGRSPSVRGTPGPQSRTTTPFSRGATPASFVSGTSSAHPSRQAVSRDEEMEMAALAEVEREIYQGMEVLEDAFEALHLKAEMVRTALRTRGAGLMLNLQNRGCIDVLPTQPGSANSLNSGYERPQWAGEGEDPGAVSDSDWGADDFELMPDDSASNISSSRHRRPKRRVERRTPAPIEEEEEN